MTRHCPTDFFFWLVSPRNWVLFAGVPGWISQCSCLPWFPIHWHPWTKRGEWFTGILLQWPFAHTRVTQRISHQLVWPMVKTKDSAGYWLLSWTSLAKRLYTSTSHVDYTCILKLNLASCWNSCQFSGTVSWTTIIQSILKPCQTRWCSLCWQFIVHLNIKYVALDHGHGQQYFVVPVLFLDKSRFRLTLCVTLLKRTAAFSPVRCGQCICSYFWFSFAYGTTIC